MHPIARFSVLACGISWLAVLPLVLDGLGWTSLGIGPLWHALGALGPVTAAFLMRRATHPAVRIRDLYARQGRPGVSTAWLALFVLTPMVLLAIAWGAALVTGDRPDVAALGRAAAQPAWLANLVVASVFYGLGEEAGWRGWLLPRLQERHTAFTATWLLAMIWAVWHAPYFTYRYDFESVGIIFGFFAGLLAGAYWLTFVFNCTGGSVLTVAAWHTVWNAANLAAAEMSPAMVTVLNASMMVLGFGVVVVWGRRGLTVASKADSAHHAASPRR